MQDFERYFAASLPVVRRVIHLIARRHRLSPEDEAEFTSVVFLKLVSDDYAVLRRFRGQSGLAAYLGVVITRALLDWRNTHWGKWRPSAQARRIGDAAVTLERLIDRDRLDPREAVAMMAHEPRWGLSSASVRGLREQLPDRAPRPQMVEVLDVATPHTSDHADHQIDAGDVAERVERARCALKRALADLSWEDRRLLALRFRAGLSVAEIARLTGSDQRLLYRRLKAVLAEIGRNLEQRQLTRGEVFDLVGHRLAAIDHVLGESTLSSVGTTTH